jgi:hypothetical protein
MKKLLYLGLLAISNCSLFSNGMRYIDLSNIELGSCLNSHTILNDIYKDIISKEAFNGINLRENRLDLMDDEDWTALLNIIETLRDFGNGIWIGLEFTNLKYVSQEYRKRLGQSIKKTGCKQVYPCVQGNGLITPYWECSTVLDIVDELNPKKKSGHFSEQDMINALHQSQQPLINVALHPDLRFPNPPNNNS